MIGKVIIRDINCDFECENKGDYECESNYVYGNYDLIAIVMMSIIVMVVMVIIMSIIIMGIMMMVMKKINNIGPS